MGWPRAHYSWSALRCLGRAQFHLSLLGLLFSLSLLGWAWSLKIQLGDHMDVAQPGDGYLWPATVVVVVVFVLPVHLTAIALRPAICRNLEKHGPAAVSARSAIVLVGHSGARDLRGQRFLLEQRAPTTEARPAKGSATLSDRSGHSARRRSPANGAALLRRRFLSRLVLSALGSAQLRRLLERRGQRPSGQRQREKRSWTNERRSKVSSARLGSMFYGYGSTLLSRRIDSSDGDYYEEKLGPLVSGDVPYSCCLVDILRECVHRELLSSELGRSEPTISHLGCHVKILGRADDAGRDVMACLIFLTVYQTARRSALSHETCGEPQYEAWLFGVKGQLAPARYSELRMLRPDNDQDYSASSSSSSDFEGLDCDPSERYRDFGRLKGGRDVSYNDDDCKSCEADEEEHQPKSDGHYARFKSAATASKMWNSSVSLAGRGCFITAVNARPVCSMALS
uniref:Uncharacterized protein n=1 Tax=Trichogramma kaykai TaxID=54128 RepID=A0ABD2X128_9HYME